MNTGSTLSLSFHHPKGRKARQALTSVSGRSGWFARRLKAGKSVPLTTAGIQLQQMGLRLQTSNSRSGTEVKSPVADGMGSRKLKRDASRLWSSHIEDESADPFDTPGGHEGIEIPRCIILPNSNARFTWDVVIVFLMVYTIIYLPYKIGFGTDSTWDIVELVVDVFFLADVAVSFFLAVENEDGSLCVDRREIACRYLRSWFFVDIVAAFPFSLLGFSNVSDVTHGVKTIKLLRMVKILRLYRIQKLYNWVIHHPAVHKPTLKLTWFMLLLFMFSYISGCLWHFCGEIEETDDSWIDRAFGTGIRERSSSYKLLVSMYWSLTTLTTVGYGDISAQTSPEIIFSLVIMLCGASLFSFITASAIQMLKRTDNLKIQLKADIETLVEFARRKGLSAQIVNTAVMNLQDRYLSKTGDTAEIEPVLEKLSPQLHRMINRIVHADLLQRSSFFKQFSNHPHFIDELLTVAKQGLVYPGEFVVNQGGSCNEFYIMQTGKVSYVFTQTAEIKIEPLGDWEIFGHEFILVASHAFCNVLCVKETHFLTIDRKSFLQILSRFPDRFHDIHKMATDRLASIRQQVQDSKTIIPRRRSSSTTPVKKAVLDDIAAAQRNGAHGARSVDDDDSLMPTVSEISGRHQRSMSMAASSSRLRRSPRTAAGAAEVKSDFRDRIFDKLLALQNRQERIEGMLREMQGGAGRPSEKISRRASETVEADGKDATLPPSSGHQRTRRRSNIEIKVGSSSSSLRSGAGRETAEQSRLCESGSDCEVSPEIKESGEAIVQAADNGTTEYRSVGGLPQKGTDGSRTRHI